MLISMLCAGLLMYLCVALSFTIGYGRFPGTLLGYLISFVPPIIMMHSIIAHAAATHPEWLFHIAVAVIMGIFAGGGYLHMSRVFELEK